MQKNVPTIITTSCIHYRASDIVELSAQLTDVDKARAWGEVILWREEAKRTSALAWFRTACIATGGTAMANSRHQPAHPRASVGHVLVEISFLSFGMEQARWEQNIPETMACTHHSV